MTPGPSPLPAKVCLPFQDGEEDSFYKVEDPECWYADPTQQDQKQYEHKSTQMAVREFIETAIIDTVESIMYDIEVLTGIDRPTFGIPFGQKPQHVYMKLRSKLADFKAKNPASDVSITLECIGLYQLSEAVVGLCGIFIAGRNWNAVAGKFGAALITLGKMVWYAESPLLVDRITRLKGVPLGGQRHGSPETKYVAYMVSTLEEVSPGVVRNFIESADHVFESSKHGEAILQILGCDRPLRKKCPLWPTRAHTLDFAAQWEGTNVIDGECKLSAFEKGPEAAVLVLHATEQLNWADEAVSMLTTSSNISFYFSKIQKDFKKVSTRVVSPPVPFKISHELPCTAKDVQCATPPPCHIVENGNVRVVTRTDPDILDKWKEMNIQKRTFVTQIMWALDVLVKIFGCGNYAAVRDKVYNAFLHKGLREPYFVSGAARVDIPEQAESQFYYSSKNMGPVMERKRARAEVSDTLKDFVSRFTVSDELQHALIGTSEALARDEEMEGGRRRWRGRHKPKM